MNAATFFVYNLVMKSCSGLFNGAVAAEAAASQAYDHLRERVGGGLESMTSGNSSWSRRRSERLCTITTDMPNILLVKQPTAISQVSDCF